MAIVSSKPSVVRKATRAPVRSSMVLVPTVVPWRTFEVLRCANLPQSVKHRQRRIVRSRENLQNPELAGFKVDAIGERAASIDRYAQIVRSHIVDFARGILRTPELRQPYRYSKAMRSFLERIARLAG